MSASSYILKIRHFCSVFQYDAREENQLSGLSDPASSKRAYLFYPARGQASPANLGCSFQRSAARLQQKHLLFNPRHGFYVAVPPQFLSWEAPPPAWYIDDLMKHEGRPYYVALLKAAELHGATHHAVMEFQVITDRQLPKIRAGRSFIVFLFPQGV